MTHIYGKVLEAGSHLWQSVRDWLAFVAKNISFCSHIVSDKVLGTADICGKVLEIDSLLGKDRLAASAMSFGAKHLCRVEKMQILKKQVLLLSKMVIFL